MGGRYRPGLQLQFSTVFAKYDRFTAKKFSLAGRLGEQNAREDDRAATS
jgi:hypothetical protein